MIEYKAHLLSSFDNQYIDYRKFSLENNQELDNVIKMYIDECAIKELIRYDYSNYYIQIDKPFNDNRTIYTLSIGNVRLYKIVVVQLDNKNKCCTII